MGRAATSKQLTTADIQSALLHLNSAFERFAGQSPAMILVEEMTGVDETERQYLFENSVYHAMELLWCAVTENKVLTLKDFEEEFADQLADDDEDDAALMAKDDAFHSR